MSGVYKPLIIGFGVVSSVLCVWIAHRLGILDSEGVPMSIRIGNMLKYAFWLVVEIGKADWAVTKVILSPAMPVSQRLVKVPATQLTDLGKAGPRPQQVGGKAVAKKVGAVVRIAMNAGPLECLLRNHRDGATGGKTDVRSKHPQK